MDQDEIVIEGEAAMPAQAYTAAQEAEMAGWVLEKLQTAEIRGGEARNMVAVQQWLLHVANRAE